MDFIPRYPQPFTLVEATRLDVSTITDEISRLQNSLQHLKRTQTSLHEYIEAQVPQNIDPEIKAAFEENKIVVGAQEERIMILKLALSEKGVRFGSHYAVEPSTITQPTHPHASGTPTGTSQEGFDAENGIHL